MFLIDSLLGLPAHPLLVHAAVVLVPLAAIGLLATGWKAEWRRWFSLPVAAIAVVGAGFAYLAKESGESLERAVRVAAEAQGAGRVGFGEHPEQGDTAFIAAALLALACVGFWAVSQWGSRFNAPRWAPYAAYGVALLPAIFATAEIIIAGHSGAALVWKDVGSFTAGK